MTISKFHNFFRSVLVFISRFSQLQMSKPLVTGCYLSFLPGCKFKWLLLDSFAQRVLIIISGRRSSVDLDDFRKLETLEGIDLSSGYYFVNLKVHLNDFGLCHKTKDYFWPFSDEKGTQTSRPTLICWKKLKWRNLKQKKRKKRKSLNLNLKYRKSPEKINIKRIKRIIIKKSLKSISKPNLTTIRTKKRLWNKNSKNYKYKRIENNIKRCMIKNGEMNGIITKCTNFKSDSKKHTKSDKRNKVSRSIDITVKKREKVNQKLETNRTMVSKSRSII